MDRWNRLVCGLAWIVSGTILPGSVVQAAISGADEAGNYSAGTFTNGANQGSGFAAWSFNDGEDAVVGLADSTTGSGNINSTNDRAFFFYGGVTQAYAEATRALTAPLAVGDVVSLRLAYNFGAGARGLNLLDAANNELLNINFSDDNLSYTFAGTSGVVVSSTYVSTAVLQVAVTQLAGNQIGLTLARNDGFTTNVVSTTLSAPGAKIKFYNGGHAADNVSQALFVNDLQVNAINTLRLDGIDAMAAGMTNLMTLVRGGSVDVATAGLFSSDGSAAIVPATVDLDAGAISTNFTIEGLGLGTATISAQIIGYPTPEFDVDVYDLGYDDTAYGAASFTNDGNSGLGFQPWILQGNNGEGVGYTNFTGVFVGNSTFGGPDVNSSAGTAYALYANGQGGGNPYANAIRPFNNPLAVGQVVSFELGVNFRNGAKGAALQSSGFGIFEVGIYSDDYWYKIGNGAPVSLGWEYASDSAIKVEFARVTADRYNISIFREGSAPETNTLSLISLPGVPNEIRFFSFGTDSGDNANNLYFNRLALYSGQEIPVLSISGHDGMVVNRTNLFTITRSGPTNGALSVSLSNTDTAVFTVPATVEIADGSNAASFAVVALSNGVATIGAGALDAIGDTWPVEVFDIAYDDTTYYPPALFESGGNGGSGFLPWVIGGNAGPGEGYTNFVGAVLSDSTFGGPNVNSSAGDAFTLFANAAGPSTNPPLAEAVRPFAAELAVGQSVSFDLGVNFRNGAKGVMFQNAGTWLLEIAVFNDDYWYNVRSQGDNPVSLGWAYASDSAIEVILSRTGTDSYNLSLVRSGGASTNSLIQNINISQVPDRVRFYAFNTDSGDANNLYVNDLAMFTGTVGESVTDGIPNSWWNQYGIPAIDRVAAADYDNDGFSNLDEYIADTNPDNNTSYFENRVNSMSGTVVFNLQTGPTATSRVYDIWWSTNLTANPQQWNRLGVTTAGNGGTLTLSVTNDAPLRYYRTGVALP